MKKALLIDHDDSFTQNLKHWLRPVFDDVKVIHHSQLNSENILDYDLCVLSPGPKSPQDYPQTLSWLRRLDQKTPVFGVCLGMQMMVMTEGGLVKAYSSPKHGKKSKLKILKSKLAAFNELEVARYHSLKTEISLEFFDVLAESSDDQIPMWIEHKNKKWMGVQFHPESFLTENSDLYLQFLKSWLQQ